ncbi:hypothetical protein OSB04_024260 [Centaurea solstitialis]|uniref:Pentatricopeptide repeat-containing protein n=1 Tax=Centaurea solstitialis TaxID=347529 RepID=A0AA38T596_9ASTR|nr:hypothetical protein OSB04_024260 [Centaurea solstitialis]
MGLGYPVTTVTGQVQKQIVDALHLGERERASSLLSHIGYNKPILLADNFVQILEYCTLAPDPLFAMEICRTMEEKGIDMNNECHNLVILALCKGGYLEEAFNLMSSYGETPDCYPTLSKYNTLLRASAKMRSLTHASECLDLMERDMVGKNEVTYGQLLKLAVFQKNLSAVHNIWKEYTRYYSFNLISLREFIWSFSRLGDIDAACEALRQMVDLAFKEGFIIKKNAGKQMLSLPIPFYNKLDWSRCRKDKITSVASLYKYDPTQANSMDHQKVVAFDMKDVKGIGTVLRNPEGIFVIKVLRLSFTHAIKACVRAENHKLAEQLFFQMQNLGIHPSRGAYDGLIRVLARTRGFHDGMEVLKLMQEKNLKPLDSTLAALSISCSKGLELDLAEAFLNQMAKCERPYPFNALLKACHILDRPERGVHVFGKMKQLKVTPNIKTYELLFSLFGNVNAPYEIGNILSQAEVAKRIHVLEDDMMRNGIQHSYLSIRNLLHVLGSEGMISRLLHYLRVAENQYPPRTPIYNIVLHSLVDAEEGDVAINVFKTLMSHGYHPNNVTLSIMIECCTITRSLKSALGLIAMGIRYGYPPNAQAYTSLIKAVLTLEDFDEALTLLDKACSEGIEIDALLFNAILKEAVWKVPYFLLSFVDRIKPPFSLLHVCLFPLLILLLKIHPLKDTRLMSERFSRTMFRQTCNLQKEGRLLKTYLGKCLLVSLTLQSLPIEHGNRQEFVPLRSNPVSDGNDSYPDRIDIIEYVMDRMLKENVRPDAVTCGHVFSMYIDRGFYNTAMEALQVMSICMLSEEDINENTTVFEDDFIYAEDSEAESRILEHFMDSEHYSVAFLNLRWCAMQGNMVSWSIHDSPWVNRLSATNRFLR